jgi:homoserine kinase type II
MILSKPQAQKICKQYNLGKLKSFELFPHGLINFNYKLSTDKGIFVVRILGSEMDDWKRNKFNLEQQILSHLEKKNFPYEIPLAVKDSNGEVLGKIGKLSYWVYPFLEGESRVELNNERLKEIAKAIAIYYKYVKDFKIKKSHGDFSLDWFLEQYKTLEGRLSNLKKPNKTDKLVKKNFELFHKTIKRLSKMNFMINPIVAHGDIIKSNVLFQNNKLTAIIDFDNLKVAPRTEDIAYAIRLHAVNKKGVVRDRYNLMLKEYEKVKKLSKKEKEMIFPLMLRGNVIVFWWMYAEMKKALDKKYEMIKWNVETTKAILKEWLK